MDVEHKLTFKNSCNILNTFKDQKTQLFLEKIKIEEKPEYKKFLHNYFNDPSKYFLKNFKNNPIIVGKKYNKRNGFKIKFEVTKSPKRKLKKNFVMKSEQKNKSSSDQSSNSQNRPNTQKDLNININNLKSGQRYVDDLELNEIFSNFKHTQKANKFKVKNNLRINDIRKFRAENLENSKSIKGRILMRKKTIKLMKALNSAEIQTNNLTENNFGKLNERNPLDILKKYNSFNNNSNFSTVLNKKTFQNNRKSSDKNITNSNDSLTSKSNNLTRYNDSNNNSKIKSVSTISYLKNENNSHNKFSRFYSTLYENNSIDIFKKQNQYLTSEKFKIFKKELGDILVSQENTFLKDVNSKIKNIKISSFMSNKLKIPKEKLLMNRTEYFRINNDLKSRLSKQMQYEYIEDFYEWEKTLKNFDNKKKYEEIIRDPKYKIKNYPKKRFYSFNNEYLVKRISKNNLKKFVSNIDNIKYNFKGLYIKGKNLLELEQELAKGIKGKKILNNFEEVLPFSSLKEEVYAKHFQL